MNHPFSTTCHSLSFLAALMIGASLSGAASAAPSAASLTVSDDFSGVALTHESTLNDLVRRLPIFSRSQERDLAGLSAIQEHLVVHERRMRGEDLPEDLQALFGANYSAIVAAIVDDRITMIYGRELLDVHRQLLDRAYSWAARPVRDAHYGEVVLLALKELAGELDGNAEPLALVPACVRTPVVKGHLLWIEELIYSGGNCPVLSRGELGSLAIQAQRIERFEGYYKRDQHLTRIERENLHERLIDLNRELIDALRW